MAIDEEQKVWVDGKLVSVTELKAKYGELSVAGTPTTRRIIEALAVAKKPLTRSDIAKAAALASHQYVAGILKKLAKDGYVMEIEMPGTNYKYYLLTEKGIKEFGHQQKLG
ncbi:MAG: hypothetical protein ABSA11_10430 [Candidatus Bathyarchaeia archaeon]|jgi:chromosome segregation and condensation protein ScpB